MNFDTGMQYFWGFFLGLLFGVVLQRGHAARFHVIVGQLLGRDWTLAKIATSAAAFGAIGIWLLAENDLAGISPVIAGTGELILGGILFGIGLAVLGYGPGTTLVAAAEGRADALCGAAGLLVGGLAFVLIKPGLAGMLASTGNIGHLTLPDVTGTSAMPWIVALFLVAAAVGVLGWKQPVAPALTDERTGEPIPAA